MSAVVLEVAEVEADELRAELGRLEEAISVLTLELVQARGDRDDLTAHLDEHRALLDDALALRGVLEDRLAGLEAALERARTTAEIRRKLLAGITETRWRERRAGIARAKRVEKLLG